MHNKTIKQTAVLFCIAGMAASVSAYGAKESGSDTRQKRPTAAVSIVPEKTFAEAVCGDRFDIVTMIPPGYSPENYEPVPQELEKFSTAAVYFSIGVPAESTNILPRLSGTTKLVSLADETAKVYPDLKMGDGRDPHIWMSPKRVIVIITSMAKEFAELDPANGGLYKKNAGAYIGKIAAAEREIVTTLKPVKNRSFIVFHPAFGYFADDFGLKMYALEEEGKEASAARMMNLITTARKEHITAVFYQAEIDSSQSQALAEEIGGKTVKLEPLSPDYIPNLKLMAATIAGTMK